MFTQSAHCAQSPAIQTGTLLHTYVPDKKSYYNYSQKRGKKQVFRPLRAKF